MALDVLGSLPKADRFKKILVGIDLVSRYVYAEPMTNKTSAEIIRAFNSMCKNMGFPCQVHSDNGGAFKSKEWADFRDSHHIKHTLSVPYNPRSNSLAEKSIQNLISYLRVLCENHPK